jgi:hypothetical protein
MIIGSAVVVTASHTVFARWLDFYGVLSQGRLFAYHGLFLSLATLFVCMPWLKRRISRRDLWGGAALGWGLSLASTAIFAPGASATFEWPLFFALPSAAVWTFAREVPSTDGVSKTRSSIVAAYAGLVPLVWMTSVVLEAVLVAAGMGAPALPAIVFAAALAMFAPLWMDACERRFSAWMAGGFALVAVALAALAVARGRSRQAAHPTDSLIYALDVDAGDARWVTLDDSPDEWIRSLGLAESKPERLDSMFVIDAPVRTVAARRARLSPPSFELLDQGVEEGKRAITMHVRSPTGARCFHLWQVDGPAIVDVLIDGRRPHRIVRFSSEFDEAAMRVLGGERTRRVWRLVHCGGAERSTPLRLIAAGNGPIHMRLLAETDGWPAGENIPLRTAHAVPSQESDVTLVGRSVEVPACAAKCDAERGSP